MSGDFLLQTLLEYDITVSTCSIWGKNIDQNSEWVDSHNTRNQTN